MVDSITSFSRSGTRDWFFQRASAVVIALCFFVLVGYWFFNPGIDYYKWQHFFSFSVVKYLIFLSYLAILVHAWIGMWTVVTDYVKYVALRFTVQIIVILSLMVYLAWIINIIWYAR